MYSSWQMTCLTNTSALVCSSYLPLERIHRTGQRRDLGWYNGSDGVVHTVQKLQATAGRVRPPLLRLLRSRKRSFQQYPTNIPPSFRAFHELATKNRQGQFFAARAHR